MSLVKAIEHARAGAFLPASDEAVAEGELQLRYGERRGALEAFEIAGHWAARAGRPDAALARFERALAIHEHDLVHMPVPRLVVSHLAHIPALFSGAAFAALDLGDALRAVAIAERGRCRALGQRVGRRAVDSPPGAVPADWEAYVRTWRAVITRSLANAERPRGDPEEKQLRALSDRLVAAGVARAELVPVAHAIDPASIELPDATAVLYAIRSRDRLGFVVLDARGAEPIVPDGGSALLAAVDALAAGRPEDPVAIWQANRRLLAAAQTSLAPVLERALATAPRRLVWVPHASLVAIPLAACTVGAAAVVDRVAVLHAPSLTAAVATEVAPAGPIRACVIEGRADAGTARTDGGEVVVRAIDPRARPQRPRDRAELAAALRDAAVVHMSCHGTYAWESPLATRLALGGSYDLTIEELYDHVSLAPATLVVFGACDSGVTVQGDLNEPLGLPMTMLNVGAQACIGATWPIRRFPGAAVCAAVIRGLAAGDASPEALAAAVRWLRGATNAQFKAMVTELGHPIAQEFDYLRIERDEPAFPDAIDWGGFVHWGAAWRAPITLA